MRALIDILPGIRLPVAEVTKTLAEMWRVEAREGSGAPSEFRAWQMNLILHYGLSTTEEEALDRFYSALRFAQRYPCRIIVLCPVESNRSEELMEGKVYSQCFIGQSQDEMVCCEALMLGYPTSESDFLENQVSIWLDNDLPTCHWFHRVPIPTIEAYYLGFISHFRRVVYDSSVEKDDFKVIAWPHPEDVKDLALARILPVRQTIGQFLSAFPPHLLVEGLIEVRVEHAEGRKGEGEGILQWLETCLRECFRQSRGVVRSSKRSITPLEKKKDETLAITLEYEGEKYFRWIYREKNHDAILSADFGTGPFSFPSQLNLLNFEKALAESLYFN